MRELPEGILDALTPEQVAEVNGAENSWERVGGLVGELPSSERHVLTWAVDLMTDVAEYAGLNKMNAHNVATVFAPNMSQVRTTEVGRERGVAIMDTFFSLRFLGCVMGGRVCHSWGLTPGDYFSAMIAIPYRNLGALGI